VHAIVKNGPVQGFVHVTDHPERAVGPGEVRIEVVAASPCGTDRELVAYTPAAVAFGLAFPVVMGHEVSGIVVETAPDVAALQVGERVALESHIACTTCFHCRTGQAHNCLEMILLGVHTDGGFAERVVVPQQACFRLPDGVPTETGALFESAGVAVHALQRSGVELPGASVLVAGGGPIGIVLTQLARAGGARRVAVVEPNPFRRAMAESFGAVGLEPGPPATEWCLRVAEDRGGFDVGFDCTGAPGAFDTILRSLRREATAMCVGVPNSPFSLDVTRHVIKQGLTIRGSFGRALWSTWNTLGALVASGRIDLDAVVTHRMGLEDFDRALELQTGDAGKVVLRPNSA
jgi:threonine 3-dehydrogenase